MGKEYNDLEAEKKKRRKVIFLNRNSLWARNI